MEREDDMAKIMRREGARNRGGHVTQRLEDDFQCHTELQLVHLLWSQTTFSF